MTDQLTPDQIDQLVDALRFYACAGVYFGVAVWGDPPTGGFDEDISEDHGNEDLPRAVPGALARRTLRDLGIPWDPEVWGMPS